MLYARRRSQCQHITQFLVAISETVGGRFCEMPMNSKPASYEELISLAGMGPAKIRALALVSDLVFGTEPSWQDPATYSFAQQRQGWVSVSGGSGYV